MRTAIALALLLAACKSAPAPERHLNEQAALHPRSRYGEDPAYVQALREELEALRRIQAVLGWYAGTQGETSLQKLTYVGHDRLFQKAALDAIAAAEQQPGVTPNDALALRFVRRTLAGEIVQLSTASFSDEYADVEAAATVTLPWKDKPVAYRDLQNLIAQEEDPDRRRQIFAAMNAVRVQKLNPILQCKEQAAQKAARETGLTDYVALSEDLRNVKLDPLLAAGVWSRRGTARPPRRSENSSGTPSPTRAGSCATALSSRPKAGRRPQTRRWPRCSEALPCAK